MGLRRRAWQMRLLAAGLVLDTLLGVSTATNETLASMELFAPGYCDYEPAPWTALVLALGAVRVPHGSVLLDVGSGKGRAVLAASSRRFSRVVGVELAPALHATAEANLRAYRGPRRAAAVELACADITRTAVDDDVTHVLLNNPLIDEAADRFFSQLTTSIGRRPRRVTVLYVHEHGDALRRTFPQARRRRRLGPLAVYEIG